MSNRVRLSYNACAMDCPSLETLATYIAHNLKPEEVEPVEAHLCDCQRCRQIVILVIKSQEVVPDP